MNFANWETKDNMEKMLSLVAVDSTSEIKSTGLPVAYDEEKLYITKRLDHTLVIGSTGSGKTQTITLPILELAARSGESVVIHDTKNELYERTKDNFERRGYNVVRLNFDDARDCNYWNPFELPNRLYKEGNKDKAQELIEDLGFYLLNDLTDTSDPFWINSTIDYFTGLTLYAIEKNKEVNLDTILDLDTVVRSDSKELLAGIDKKSNIYINLRGALEAPPETKGSILSVFSQRIKRYISKENLKNVLSKTDFDFSKISAEKTIIYIVSGNSNNSEHLLPLLISQIYYAKDEYTKNEGKINVIVDDFFGLYPIRSFSKMLNFSRGIGISFTVIVRGFNDLKNIYGKEETEILKLCFANIVYLLSQDIETLEEISSLCGKTCDDGIIKPLISVEALKTMSYFEAILLTPRLMPFKTKLLPYYQMKL